MAAGLAVIWRGVANSSRLEMREETIPILDLPEAFEGFRLLFLSDFHFRRHSSRPEELLTAIEQIDPDMVCLGGDYAFTALSLPEVAFFFRRLALRPGVVGVYGNTDYREGITFAERESWGTFSPSWLTARCAWSAGESDCGSPGWMTRTAGVIPCPTRFLPFLKMPRSYCWRTHPRSFPVRLTRA